MKRFIQRALVAGIAALGTMAVNSASAFAGTVNWSSANGNGTGITVAVGTAYTISGGNIWYMPIGGTNWSELSPQPVTASGFVHVTQISASKIGNLWALTNVGQILEFVGGQWTTMNPGGDAVQIAAGPDGQGWAIGNNGSIYSAPSGSTSWTVFTAPPSAPTQISVSATGQPWVIGQNQEVYSWNSSSNSWQDMKGTGTSIAAGPYGDAWVVNGGNAWYLPVSGPYNNNSPAWNQENSDGTVTSIAVSPGDVPWVLDAGNIWYGTVPQVPLTWSNSDITFPSGIALGGSIDFVPSSSGVVTLSGSFYDSGAADYNVSVACVLKDSMGNGYTATASGTTYGTFSNGSRTWSYDVSNNADTYETVENAWASIEEEQLMHQDAVTCSASETWNTTQLMEDLLEAEKVSLAVFNLF